MGTCEIGLGGGVWVDGETTERDDWKEGAFILESGRNLIQGKLPQVYNDNPSRDS